MQHQLVMFQVEILPELMLEKVRQDHLSLRIWSAWHLILYELGGVILWARIS